MPLTAIDNRELWQTLWTIAEINLKACALLLLIQSIAAILSQCW